jgi:uncharacterized membrane protein
MSDGDKGFFSSLKDNFLNPVVFIALSILISIFVLIGTAILGRDNGVLAGMARTDFARGLITYLFAIVTIGTAVVLVVSALTSANDPQNERRFERGKEILSLLLGVFGTIVGFYFGSEVSAKNTPQELVLKLLPARLSSTQVVSKSQFTVTTFVTGGEPPYRYGVNIGNATPELKEKADANGWINSTLVAPDVSSEQDSSIKIRVEDANGHSVEESEKIKFEPPH